MEEGGEASSGDKGVGREGKAENREEKKDKKEQTQKEADNKEEKEKVLSLLPWVWVLGILRHAVTVYISLATHICLTISLQFTIWQALVPQMCKLNYYFGSKTLPLYSPQPLQHPHPLQRLPLVWSSWKTQPAANHLLQDLVSLLDFEILGKINPSQIRYYFYHVTRWPVQDALSDVSLDQTCFVSVIH